MQVGLIYARARNGVIGRDGGMPWHLPQDLAHFRQVTQGCPVVMGRKTWDSLPPRFRPLPGRRNIVVTRQATWQADGAERAASLEQALALCRASHPEPAWTWVIGGGELYAQALPLAQAAEVTEIELTVEGDTVAPTLDARWRAVSRSAQRSPEGLDFAWVRYQREPAPSVPSS